jgi:DNA polymerase gamma 1
MRMSFRGYPVYYLHDHYWCFKAPLEAVADLCPFTARRSSYHPGRSARATTGRRSLLPHPVAFRGAANQTCRQGCQEGRGNGLLTSPYADLLNRLTSAGPDTVVDQLMTCAKDMLKDGRETEWGAQLDWTVDSSSGGWRQFHAF